MITHLFVCDVRMVRVARFGHPEGYLEGFANLYNDIADIISGINDNGLVPDLHAGLDGRWFISSCLISSNANGIWVYR